MNKALKGLGIITTIAMLFVLIGGALVTKTGSGMGRGDLGRFATEAYSRL